MVLGDEIWAWLELWGVYVHRGVSVRVRVCVYIYGFVRV